MKIILLAVVAIFFFNGCISKQLNTNKESKNNYIKYNNLNHVVGNKSTAIDILTYNEVLDGQPDTKITFYIDKYPFYKKFNLCQDKKTVKKIKSVEYTEGKKDKLIYETVNINCDSYVKINEPDSNEIWGSYNFNFLRGFNIAKLRGHDVLLEKTSKYNFPFGSLYSSRIDLSIINDNRKAFWSRKSN